MPVKTYGQKLAVGFALVVGLTIVMGLVAYYALTDVTDQQERMTRHLRNLTDAQTILTLTQGKSADARGYLLTRNDALLAGMRTSDDEMRETLNRIAQRDLAPELARQLTSVEAASSAHEQALRKVLSLRRAGEDPAAVSTRFDEDVVPRYRTLNSAVQSFVDIQEERVEEVRAELQRTSDEALTLVILIGCGAAIIAILIAGFLTRNLTRQIGRSVQHVRSSSAELQAAATQQASGAREQATAMREITTTIGELVVTARQIAESAQRVARIAGDTASSARAGDEELRSVQDGVEGIRRQVDTIVTHMLDLGHKSQEVGGILDIINELADQTNILAINATIEAAGAGDSGRRFAVVGEEIRRLADRVGSSTREIRGLIEQIRTAVNTTVMATESGSKTVDSAVQRFADLTAGFQRIGTLVETTTEAAREIELSTKQQTTAVEQVNAAIADVAQASRESEAGASQTAQTASQLTSLSDDLDRLIQSRQALSA